MHLFISIEKHYTFQGQNLKKGPHVYISGCSSILLQKCGAQQD